MGVGVSVGSPAPIADNLPDGDRPMELFLIFMAFVMWAAYKTDRDFIDKLDH
jgi:hypothetical protein